jgi:hypothetical protein
MWYSEKLELKSVPGLTIMQTRSSSKLESIKNRFFKTAKEELSDEIASDDKTASIFLIVVNGLLGLYLIVHQTVSTGFFTSKFNTLEMLLLYGIFIYWIITSVLILIGQKHPSRDLDSYGGLFFATFAIGWLIVIFPFDFAHFANVLPDFLRFLLQWISNEIALVLLIIFFIIHLIFAVYSLILRLYVHKTRKKILFNGAS